MLIIKQKFINREDLQDNPDLLYVFGDNEIRSGMGGQAGAMRGEPNAFGIATLSAPGTPWLDEDFEHNFEVINNDILDLLGILEEYNGLVFPTDGVGTGLARLQENAPITFGALQLAINVMLASLEVE